MLKEKSLYEERLVLDNAVKYYRMAKNVLSKGYIPFDAESALEYLENDIRFQNGLKALSQEKTTVNELREVLYDLNAKTSGKKAELKKRLKNVLALPEYDIKTKDDITTLYPWENGAESVYNYIAKNDLHVVLSKACIKSLAFPIVKKSNDGNIMQIFDSTTESCNKIFQSSYSELIFDDICQSMFETLLLLAMNGEIWIEGGKVMFSDMLLPIYLKKDGKIVKADGKKVIVEYGTISSFMKCFKSVRNTLKSFSNPKVNPCGLYSIDFDENGQEIIVTERSTKYIMATSTACNIQDFETRSDVKAFVKYVRKHEKPKKAEQLLFVLTCRLNGYKQEDIPKQADRFGLKMSIATVKRNCLRIKLLWHESNLKIRSTTYESTFNGCTYRKSDYSASGSYGFKYSDTLYSDTQKSMKETEYSEEWLQNEYFQKNNYFFHIRKAEKSEAEKAMEHEKMLLTLSENSKGEKHIYKTVSGKTIVFIDGKIQK